MNNISRRKAIQILGFAGGGINCLRRILATVRNEDLIKAAFADRWVLASTALSHRKLPLPNPERSRRVAG